MNDCVEKEVFERKRARQPSSIYTNSMTRQPLHGIIRMNTGCSKCLSEKSLLKCTHISESVQEEHDNRRIMGRNIENLEPELSGEPRRKHRDRKKIWYPHDFHQNEDDRANLIAQVRRVLSNEIFVIPEESSSLFPSESNGVSSPNIKSEDLMESSLPIQLIRQFLP